MKDAEMRAVVFDRAGHRCEFPNCRLPVSSVNPLELAHLKGKQMGGSKHRNDPDNGACLCLHHHGWLDGRTMEMRRLDNEDVLRAALGRMWVGRR